MTDVLEYKVSVLDDSGVVGLIDADFYAAFAQSIKFPGGILSLEAAKPVTLKSELSWVKS